MAKYLEKLGTAFDTIFETIMALLTGLLVIFACYQVVARKFFGWGITWTEESMRYIFIATIMLGVHFTSKTPGFATLTLFSDFVEKRTRKGFAVLILFQYIVQIIFYFLMFYYGVKLSMMSVNRLTTATRIPFALIYLPIPIGGFMGFINILIKLIIKVRSYIIEKEVNNNAI